MAIMVSSRFDYLEFGGWRENTGLKFSVNDLNLNKKTPAWKNHTGE